VKEICKMLHIGRSTLYRYVREEKSVVGAMQQR